MIPIEHYSTLYYSALTLAALMLSLPLLKNAIPRNYIDDENNLYSSILLLITILFIGLRDPLGSWKYLGDTATYTNMFSEISWEKLSNSRDFGFDFFMYFCAQIMTVRWFYLLCATLYAGLPYLAFKKWFGNRAWMALLAYVVTLSFWSFGINGLRNGLGAAFFIYGISLINNPLKMSIWFILSMSLHKSMLLPIGAFLLTRYVQNSIFFIRIWLLAIPVAFFYGNNMEAFINNVFGFIGLSDRRTENLFVNELDGQAVSRSFRLDFIIYSSVAVILGYYYVIKKKFDNKFYSRLLNTYLIANSVWILMIYATYTNRTAYLSWFLMPILLLYPLMTVRLVKHQNQWVFWIIISSLTFTLMMFLK